MAQSPKNLVVMRSTSDGQCPMRVKPLPDGVLSDLTLIYSPINVLAYGDFTPTCNLTEEKK